MMHAPILLLAVASADVCDLRAMIAGELMILHQSGARVETLAAAARAATIPDFAGTLLSRVTVADAAENAAARELAAYHFAAEIYLECDVGRAGT